MLQQTVLWTAVPKGRVKPVLPVDVGGLGGLGGLSGVIGDIPLVGPLLRGRLRVDVVVSPRLGVSPGDPASPVLADYPQFRSWPDTLFRGSDEAPISFDVEFDLGDRVERVAGEISNPPDDEERKEIVALWRAVFPAANTSVFPYEFDDFPTPPTSVELAAVVDFLRGVYTVVATDPRFGAGGDLPASADLALPGVLGQLADITAAKEPPDDPGVFVAIDLDLSVGPDGVQIGVQPGPGPGLGVPPGVPPITLPVPLPLPDVLDPLLRRQLSWHAVRSAYGQLRKVLSPSEPPPPVSVGVESLYDFHHTVSLLGDHPQLLRRLGLVFELDVPVPDNLPPQSRLRVVPAAGWSPDPSTPTASFSPWTAYVAEPDAFFVRPRDAQPEIRNGRLRLDDSSRFRIEQIDAEGGGVKALHLADNLASRSDAMPDQSGLPSLRSGGLTVIRRLADADMSQSWNDAAGFNQQVPAPGGTPPGPDPNVTLFAEHLTPGYSIDVWDDRTRSWHSLCRRTVDYRFKVLPGQPPQAPDILGLADEGFVEVAVTSGPDGQSPFVSGALFSWDGWSLSAPKPGLAAPPPDETALVGPENTRPGGIDFGPEVRSKGEVGSLPRLRFGRTYRVVARAVDVAGNRAPLTQTSPEATLEATGPITYGRFEPVPSPVVVLADTGPEGKGPAPGESVELLVVRSDPTDPGNQFAGRLAARHVAPPKTSVSMAEACGSLDALMETKGAGYGLLQVRESGSFDEPPKSQRVGPDKEKEKQYLVRPEPQLQIPYLPDPFARAALFLGLPGVPPAAVVPGQNRIPFTGAWPDTVPFRLEIVGIKEEAAPRPPNFDGARRALRVELQESATVTVRLSSAMDPGDVQVMGLTQWVAAKTPENLPAFQARALEGKNWMLMPYRELTLVHAVQRPVTPPTIPTLTAGKQAFGQTFADVACSFDVHRRSTSKVELLAQWTDPVDDVKMPGPSTTDRRAQLGKVDVSEPPPVTVSTNGGVEVVVQPPPPLALSTLHEFGDTKHHRVRYHASATTSFRDYFPGDLTPADLSRDGPEFVSADAGPDAGMVDIPSSARPASAAVLYAVPTFGWERSPEVEGRYAFIVRHETEALPQKEQSVEGGAAGMGEIAGQAVATSIRRGKGLRVYVERPWYSSGEGELLGVVFVADPLLDDEDPRKPYVTSWAVDPLWNSAAPPPQLSQASFPAAVSFDERVTLEELPGLSPDQRVSVAGHRPQYDVDRRLWFFDIEVDLGNSYFPFVKLALARYQPNSLVVADSDVKLSRVVQLDFVQVVPDRTLTVTNTPNVPPPSPLLDGPEVPEPDSPVGVGRSVSIEVHGFTGRASDRLDAPRRGTTMFALLQISSLPLGGEASWETEKVIELEARPDAVLGTVWRGTAGFANDMKHRRLVVGEVEFMGPEAISFRREVPGTPPTGIDFLRPGARYAYIESLRLITVRQFVDARGLLPRLPGDEGD